MDGYGVYRPNWSERWMVVVVYQQMAWSLIQKALSRNVITQMSIRSFAQENFKTLLGSSFISILTFYFYFSKVLICLYRCCYLKVSAKATMTALSIASGTTDCQPMTM